MLASQPVASVPAAHIMPRLTQEACLATFEQSQLEAIANALGDTEDGLTGAEIGHLLSMTEIKCD